MKTGTLFDAGRIPAGIPVAAWRADALVIASVIRRVERRANRWETVKAVALWLGGVALGMACWYVALWAVFG